MSSTLEEHPPQTAEVARRLTTPSKPKKYREPAYRRKGSSDFLKPTLGGLIFRYVLLALVTVIVVGPLIFQLSTSLKGSMEVLSVTPSFIPKAWRWENYQEAFDQVPFGRFYFNTIIVTVVRVAGQLVFASMGGYAFDEPLSYSGGDWLPVGSELTAAEVSAGGEYGKEWHAEQSGAGTLEPITIGPWERGMTRREVLAETDPMLEEAIALVIEEGEASASLIQRRLGLGYPRAARIVDLLYELGIVGEPKPGGRTRDVLVKPGADPFEGLVDRRLKGQE